MLSLFSVIREISCYEERGGMQRKANFAATTVICYNYVYTFMYELSRKQFVFSLFFPFMGACCAQIKGFTLGCRELVLVRPNVKPFI